jgi:hypothetical protein
VKLPARGIEEFALGLVDECTTSRETRRDEARMYKSYYFTGTSEGPRAVYNRCYPHIDRLNSMLFSPADVRFDIEFDETEDEDIHAMGRAAKRHLNREWHRCGLDIEFSTCVNLSLVKGCTLLKQVWGHRGLEGWPVPPEFFGVLREDISDLDRQEAFVHSTYLTKSAFKRLVVDHPEKAELLRAVENLHMTAKDSDELEDGYIHQILMGGTTPVATTGGSTGSGTVGVVGIPQPVLDPKVAKELVRIDELWVMDDERQDYTTIRMIRPDIVIEGKIKRRNLCGLTDTLGKEAGMKGHQPFTKVCANEVDGYFWGQSEIAQIYRLQDRLNTQMRNLARLEARQADPGGTGTGFSGLTLEKWKQRKRPGGFIAEENPNAKLTLDEVKVPEELYKAIETTIQQMDDVGGFMPIIQGQGEAGVRAGVHASTLQRNASGRQRDRALLVERQCVEAGDFSLKMLQAKDAEVFDSSKKTKFLLSQLPDDARVSVDSHTSSPAFQEDSQKLAFALQRAGAIDGEDLIMLTHPPHEDTLLMRAKARSAAQAKMLAEHPEMLGKQTGRKSR